MTTTRPLSNILSGVVGGLIVLVIGAVLIATNVIDTGDTKTVVRQVSTTQPTGSSAGSDGSRSHPLANASTGVSGLRNSWLSTARNWSFARLAASACSLARVSSSSARLRRVTSREIPSTPTMLPASSRYGALEVCNVNSMPVSGMYACSTVCDAPVRMTS